jgi:3-methylfumaryl-CoA hydratase
MTDVEHLKTWIGKTRSMTESIEAAPARRMQETLDQQASLAVGDPLPPLWHWIYFIESAMISGLGRDGHPARGGFLPPVELPRRMWAGGRLTFAADPILIGDEVTKRSTVADVVFKQGSTGDLCFVTVIHELSVSGEIRIREEQDLVYRNDPDPDAPVRTPKPAPTESDWSRTVTPSEVQLFRYSALTFNGHRIHYDRNYASDVEGYPGLVFHGPLTATLLAELALSSGGRALASFSFRGMAPLFDFAPFTI